MGLHHGPHRATVLALRNVAGGPVGNLRAVLPLRIFMGARLLQQLDAASMSTLTKARITEIRADQSMNEVCSPEELTALCDMALREWEDCRRCGAAILTTHPEADPEVVKSQEMSAQIDLAKYVNAADISAADSPHTVVEKLQRAINAVVQR